ncbi:cell cycle control protein cwf14 [Stemphylium lycopersici]|nr:cell cycle control protein cwf14 [Stemphylium lycopersici]
MPGATQESTPVQILDPTSETNEEIDPSVDRDRIRVLSGSTETAASFQFDGEDHTLGNALRYIIHKNPDVEFCGYSIPHPSEAKMNLRIQTYEKGLEDLMAMCDVVEKKFTIARDDFVNKMEDLALTTPPARLFTMPPVRTARASRKAPPEGFDDIEDTLLEFQNKMKDAENASHEGKKKYEMTWPIFQITHQRSRYIYDLYYEKEAISKQLYDYLLKNGYADAMLIAKWKKQGYEKTKETNFRSTCICRVPRDQLKENQEIQCVNCGCRGCASSD